MSNLENKVAIITGAGRKNGIGAAIALRLAKAGANVVVGDLCTPPPAHLANPGAGQWQELQEVAGMIEALGVRTLAVKVDVTDRAAVEAMIEQTRDAFGRLDILVNNAGVVFGPAPVVQMQEEAWRKTLEVNATGAFICCQAALPLLMQTASQHGGGRIINMASLAAYLASGEASFITGQAFNVTGGRELSGAVMPR